MNSRQRAYLRGLANKIDAKYQFGKDGLSESFLTLIDQALEANELIKIHILDHSLSDPRGVCDEICTNLNATGVQVIGSKIVIYRESVNKKTIVLPK